MKVRVHFRQSQWHATPGPRHGADCHGFFLAVLSTLVASAHAEGSPIREVLSAPPLELSERFVGGETSSQLAVRLEQADRATAAARYAEAERLYTDALKLAEKSKAPPRSMLEILAKISNAISQQGQYPRAEPHLRRALKMALTEFGGNHAGIWEAFNSLGYNLDLQGRFGEAEPLLRRALAIAIALSGERSELAAAALNNLAFNLKSQDRLNEAETLYKEALDVRLAKFGEQDVQVAEAYNNLARNFEEQGRYDDAEPYLIKSLDILRALLGENSPRTATAYYNLGLNLSARGYEREARALQIRAWEIRKLVLGDMHPDTISIYADFADEEGSPAVTEAVLRQMLARTRANLGDQHPDTADILRKLATLLTLSRRAGEAEPLIRDALRINLAAFGEQRSKVASSYTALARVLEAQKRFPEAEQLRRKVLEIDRSVLGEDHPLTAQAYTDVAFILGLQQRIPEALAFSRKAVAILRQRVRAPGIGAGTSSNDALRRVRVVAWRDDSVDLEYQHFLLLASAAMNSASTREEQIGILNESFAVAQDLASSGAGAVLAQSATRAAATSPTLQRLVRRQQDLSADIARLDNQLSRSFAQPARSSSSDVLAQRSAAVQELRELDARLASNYPRYHDLVAPAPLNLGDVQRLLAPGEGLLLVAPLQGELMVYAVSRVGVSTNRVSDMADRVSLLRCQIDRTTCAASIPQGSKGKFNRQAAYELYRDIIQPVEGALSGVSQLYVTMSGALSSLPLAVLATEPPVIDENDDDPIVLARTKWLGDKYAFVTLPTVSGLAIAPQTSNDARVAITARLPFVGYGAPTLKGDIGRERPETVREARQPDAEPVSSGALIAGLPPLPGTRSELTAMARALRAEPSSVHIGAAATELAVRTDHQLMQAKVIAFATHGVLPADGSADVSEPGLVLTPPELPSGDDNGILTASEVARLELSADWVILSACNSATSDGMPRSDSLSSLSRAFLYAGARALLASHWRVNDAATAALTVETLLAQRADPTITKSKALQQAMRTVRTGRRSNGSSLAGWHPSWAKPEVWAPFSIIGSSDR